MSKHNIFYKLSSCFKLDACNKIFPRDLVLCYNIFQDIFLDFLYVMEQWKDFCGFRGDIIEVLKGNWNCSTVENIKS